MKNKLLIIKAIIFQQITIRKACFLMMQNKNAPNETKFLFCGADIAQVHVVAHSLNRTMFCMLECSSPKRR